MAIKLKALSTFSGNEGFVKSGSVFEVSDQERADKLTSLKLAEKAGDNDEVTHEGQLNDLKKDDLTDRAKALEIKGYSSMNKDELVKAINEADSSKESSGTDREAAPKALSTNSTRKSNSPGANDTDSARSSDKE